jgi:hypothetical protein
MLALNVTQVAQPLAECLQREQGGRGGRARMEQPDPVHFPRWLCGSDQRCHEQTQGEGDNAPDGTTPHGGLLRLAL